jgi:hypothetical protein
MSTSWLNQLPALIGVVIGALGSYLATSHMENARWRREQRARWDVERRKAYSEYAHSVNRLTTQHGRIAAARGIKNDFMPTELDGALSKLVEFASDRGAAWEAVLLMGNQATIEAGRRWHAAVFRLEPFSRGVTKDCDEWSECYARAGEARNGFYEQARRDLGIHGSLPRYNPIDVGEFSKTPN